MIAFQINGNSLARCEGCGESFGRIAHGHVTDEKIKHLFHENCLPTRCYCGHRFSTVPSGLKFIAGSVGGMCAVGVANRFEIDLIPAVTYTALLTLTTSFATMGSAYAEFAKREKIPHLRFAGQCLTIFSVLIVDVILPIDAHSARIGAAVSILATAILANKCPIKKAVAAANRLFGMSVDLAGMASALVLGNHVTGLPYVLVGAGAGATYSVTQILREKWDLLEFEYS